MRSLAGAAEAAQGRKIRSHTRPSWPWAWTHQQPDRNAPSRTPTAHRVPSVRPAADAHAATPPRRRPQRGESSRRRQMMPSDASRSHPGEAGRDRGQRCRPLSLRNRAERIPQTKASANDRRRFGKRKIARAATPRNRGQPDRRAPTMGRELGAQRRQNCGSVYPRRTGSSRCGAVDDQSNSSADGMVAELIIDAIIAKQTIAVIRAR